MSISKHERKSHMKKHFIKGVYIKIAIGLIFILSIFLYSFLKKQMGDHLVINEIAFSKSDGIDWIEIYNPTINNLSLKGLYLSDKANNFSRFKIKEDIIVPSHGYVILYGNGYKGDLTNSVMLSFRISNGETVYLVAKDGSSLIDSLTALSPDKDKTEFSIGRFPDGSEEIFIMSQDTPGERNIKDHSDMPIDSIDLQFQN